MDGFKAFPERNGEGNIRHREWLGLVIVFVWRLNNNSNRFRFQSTLICDEPFLLPLVGPESERYVS